MVYVVPCASPFITTSVAPSFVVSLVFSETLLQAKRLINRINKMESFTCSILFGNNDIVNKDYLALAKMSEEELKSKTILMGFGLDSDAIHSPNEHFGLFNYYKGIETIPLFYKYFTELS